MLNAAPTPVGGSTIVPLDQNGNPSNVTVEFASGGVTQAGGTAVVIGQNAPDLPDSVKLAGTPAVSYDVLSSAQFVAPVTVCISLNPMPAGAALYHFNAATQQWEDHTIRPVPPAGPICAQVDSLSPFAVATPVISQQAPAITSASSATFRVGTAASFAVTTSGSPVAAIGESGALPAGLSFVDKGDGTATLSGTPTAAGSFTLHLTADNGVSPDATQTFTLTVNPAGGANVVVSPQSIDVGSVGFFGLAYRKVTLQSTGDAPLLLSGVSLARGAHTDANDIFLLNSCGHSLAPGKSCAIYVFFFADGIGTHSATLNISDNAPGGSQHVSVTGSAIARW